MLLMTRTLFRVCCEKTTSCWPCEVCQMVFRSCWHVQVWCSGRSICHSHAMNNHHKCVVPCNELFWLHQTCFLLQKSRQSSHFYSLYSNNWCVSLPRAWKKSCSLLRLLSVFNSFSSRLPQVTARWARSQQHLCGKLEQQQVNVAHRHHSSKVKVTTGNSVEIQLCTIIRAAY